MNLDRFIALGALLKGWAIAAKQSRLNDPANGQTVAAPVHVVTEHQQVPVQSRPESPKQVAIIGELNIELQKNNQY